MKKAKVRGKRLKDIGKRQKKEDRGYMRKLEDGRMKAKDKRLEK